MPSLNSLGSLVAATLISSNLFAAELVTTPTAPQAAPLWTATENISNPESVYFDAESNQIFVSSVAGGAGDKDGNGWISTIHFDALGRPVVTKLISGLNAPKGIRVKDGALFVSDIDVVLKIDVATGALLERVEVPGSVFLNDVAIDDAGRVYVSDLLASKIYVLENGVPSIFAEGPQLESPNGLLVHDGKLVVTTWGLIIDPATFGSKEPGHVLTIDLATKALAFVTPAPLGHLDGLELASNGDFLVSDWVAGKVFRVTQDGQASLVAEGFKNSADIGLRGETLLVPAMSSSEVIAIEL
jgi:hypothetical protein